MRNFKTTTTDLPQISTASLPDIVFILLCFFMSVTIIDDRNLLVDQNPPLADQIESLDKKEHTIEIFIGKPRPIYSERYGHEPRIQLGKKFAGLHEVRPFILEELATMSEAAKRRALVRLKVDKAVGMGIVEDVKKELQEAHIRKIVYITNEGDPLEYR